jgi:hypothetical protein
MASIRITRATRRARRHTRQTRQRPTHHDPALAALDFDADFGGRWHCSHRLGGCRQIERHRHEGGRGQGPGRPGHFPQPAEYDVGVDPVRKRDAGHRSAFPPAGRHDLPLEFRAVRPSATPRDRLRVHDLHRGHYLCRSRAWVGGVLAGRLLLEMGEEVLTVDTGRLNEAHDGRWAFRPAVKREQPTSRPKAIGRIRIGRTPSDFLKSKIEGGEAGSSLLQKGVEVPLPGR